MRFRVLASAVLTASRCGEKWQPVQGCRLMPPAGDSGRTMCVPGAPLGAPIVQKCR